ncbi:MAG: GDSL-type esterase/lipase family protein [Chryseolinea sp.]
MKKILFVLSLTLASILSQGQNVIYDTIQYAKAYHQKRLAIFKSEPITKGHIVFLGNSITEFGDWQKLLNDTGVINRGIAGDNTFGVLARLEDVIVREPGKLFIKIGINDISQNIPIEIIVKNIFTMAERVKAKSPGTQIYVHSILPTNDNVKNEYPDAFNKNDRVRLVNDQLRQHAKTNQFMFIDLYKEFKDKDGKLNVKYADADGLHLNEVGYQTWIRLLKEKGYL